MTGVKRDMTKRSPIDPIDRSLIVDVSTMSDDVSDDNGMDNRSRNDWPILFFSFK